MANPAPKPLPTGGLVEQIALLTRPETNPTEYVPFENASLYPFEPTAAPPSRVNAWWLAEAAWLSYFRDNAAIADVYRNATGMTAQLYEPGGVGFTVASSASFAIVAFRGTRPDSLMDIVTDANAGPVAWDAGFVHSGFTDALRKAQPTLDGALALLPPTLPVWFAGHSLGAALATLAAFHTAATPRPSVGICTLGSPLVGNGTFVSAFNASLAGHSLRYVNDHDIVTHLPPPDLAFPHGEYGHVDALRWIAPDGSVRLVSRAPEAFFERVFGDFGSFAPLVRSILNFGGLNLPDFLRDHTPLRYVINVWNDFARGITQR